MPENVDTELTMIDAHAEHIVNVMVCGKAGVGKTVLINHLIGFNAGETGIGRPVTADITSYSVPGSSLICYDTPGFEIQHGQVQTAIDSFCEKIKALQLTMDENQMIDAMLYCICYNGTRRFEETEAAFIAHIKNNLKIPIFIIFTQYTNKPETWLDDEYHKKVASDLEKVGCNLADDHFCPVLCYDISIYGGDYTIPAYGLDNIESLVIKEAVFNLANKIAAAKITNLETACKRASDWVIFYSFAAAAEVAIIALPGADLAVLATNEIVMAGHIFDIIFIDSKVGEYDRDRIIGALGALAVPLLGYLSGPVAFNEVIKALGLFFAPVTATISEGLAVVAGAIVGFGVTYALGMTTVDLYKRLLAGSITIEQLEKKDPAVMAEAGQVIKTHFRAGKEYAQKHPDMIKKKLHNQGKQAEKPIGD